MTWSRLFRLSQICRKSNLSSPRYLPKTSCPDHYFLGTNSTANGQLFCFHSGFAVTRYQSNKGSYGKCSQILPRRMPLVEVSYSLMGKKQPYATQAAVEKKSKKMLWYLTGLVFAMVGCSYAAVPLYRRFCQATGYGGTVQRRESVEEKIVRHAQEGTVTTREIVVQFNADVADGMPWKFTPTQREVGYLKNVTSYLLGKLTKIEAPEPICLADQDHS